MTYFWNSDADFLSRNAYVMENWGLSPLISIVQPERSGSVVYRKTNRFVVRSKYLASGWFGLSVGSETCIVFASAPRISRMELTEENGNGGINFNSASGRFGMLLAAISRRCAQVDRLGSRSSPGLEAAGVTDLISLLTGVPAPGTRSAFAIEGGVRSRELDAMVSADKARACMMPAQFDIGLLRPLKVLRLDRMGCEMIGCSSVGPDECNRPAPVALMVSRTPAPI